ncbi:MAG: galactokinase [Bacteroidota bacterium]|nr:galactokinase [Bacteroidota bacterium]
MSTIAQNKMAGQVRTVFNKFFGEPELITRSPGRINLIGEHTDYNNGFVLPAAIDKAAYIAIGRRSDNAIHLYAENLKEGYETSLPNLQPKAGHWSSYLLGVADQLIKKGHSLGGFNVVVTCDVPIGAGMSSSAAVECATAFALNELFQLKLERLDMVKIAQQAENEFVGMKCGIMDMFASMMGKKDQVIQLDCRSLAYSYFPLSLAEYKIVLFDTQVKHALVGGEYNLRRQQCEEGVSLLQQKFPEVKSLRDVSEEMLETELIRLASPTVYDRCRFVVEEIARLQVGCELLLKNDIAGFGQKMFETHDGLSQLYEVSCKELDLLAGWAKAEPAIAGARMMGGGFGGCTINLIQEDAIDGIFQRFSEKYQKETGKTLKMYIVAPEDGTTIVV